MAHKTKNFYGVTLSSFSPLEQGKTEVQFSDDNGFVVTRRTRKNDLPLRKELEDAMNGDYPIDIIVDSRGSIVWISKHDFNFDLTNASSVPTFSVWCFSKSGAQILYKNVEHYSNAKMLAKNLNEAASSTDVQERLAKLANFAHLGEVVFKVVRATQTFEVVDN